MAPPLTRLTGLFRAGRRDHSPLTSAFSLIICGLLAGVVVAAAAFPVAAISGLTAKSGIEAFDSLPTELTVQRTPQNTYLYASDNKTQLAMIYDENRKDITYEEMPQVIRDAIVAAEDRTFNDHHGVDYRGILRAFLNNKNSDAATQGASTLTMQYVRMAISYSATHPADVVAATEDTTARKAREVRYAMQVEEEMTKKEIITNYLNMAPFGAGSYGVWAASQVYFSKQPKDLTIEEAALLAGMVKAPSAYDPTTKEGKELALERRNNYVIPGMVELGFITAEQAEKAKKAEIKVNGKRTPGGCVNTSKNDWGFFCDYFYRWWMDQETFGATPYDRERRLKSGGYRIVTSLDPNVQKSARANVGKYAADGNKNALMVAAVQPGTGHVRAMAVNRVYKNDDKGNEPNSDPAKRRSGVRGTYPNTTNPIISGSEDVTGFQGGSTFKLFTLVAALEKGYPLTYDIASPRAYYVSNFPVEPNETGPCRGRPVYCPANFSTSLTGTFNMWSGFGRSVNTYFVPLEERVGADKVVDAAKRLGIKFRSEKDAGYASNANTWGAFTLGVSGTTSLDLANAYATIAADGRYCEPIPVAEIWQDKQKLAAGDPRCGQAIDKDVARAVADASRCPVGDRSATSRCAGSTDPGARDRIGKPVIGKSGTTDGYRTAAFVVSTVQLTVAGIVADPDNQNTSMQGGGDAWGDPHSEAVNPAVINTLAEAMKGKQAKEFTPPSEKMITGKLVSIPSVTCNSEDDAITRLKARGFQVQVSSERVDSTCAAGRVARTEPGDSTVEGGTVVLRISNGNSPARPPANSGGGGDNDDDDDDAEPGLPIPDIPGLPDIPGFPGGD
ncbi:membrane peptidoglycan carboxypeptidase [Catenuloplanes nepalensis]|uniref:Membrane peptidoglycan carboxypeptidase n=1 Tax=Catenuloplanes nepalensis TaxID=587533 RepID=A0ABT9MVM2_9ACTN|nr:penicillin-binding protein [Catenuloplanes nepalensis]MDP9795051.1 membrane peptidoglycan carboxypeptidase [Catenuloplanes nepalensis]